MSATIYLHGPYTFRTARHPDGTVTVHIDGPGAGTVLFPGDHAACDALARAAVAARDLLPGPVPLAELRDAPHYTEPPQESPCGPGGCTCGAHVDAAGKVTPAGAS